MPAGRLRRRCRAGSAPAGSLLTLQFAGITQRIGVDVAFEVGEEAFGLDGVELLSGRNQIGSGDPSWLGGSDVRYEVGDRRAVAGEHEAFAGRGQMVVATTDILSGMSSDG